MTIAPILVLRAALCAMCVGVAWHRSLEYDALSSLLYVELGWLDEPAANAVSATAVGAYALAGVLLLTRFARPAALWIAVWTGMLVVVGTRTDPVWPETVVGAWAVRWIGPLALFFWLRTPTGRAPLMVERALRIAAASTFAFHGVKALGLRILTLELVRPDGEYLDFLATVERTFLDVAVPQARNELLLRAIGLLDLTVALLLLVRRWPPVAAWMALWGFATASVRILEYEVTGLARFLERAPNGGVPLALLLLWWRPRQDPAPAVDRTDHA